MKTTVLVFHDKMQATSKVNKVYADALKKAGFEVRDLYALYPDFAVDVAAEQAVLSAADRIVIVFPMYWYSSPALLKQYEDLVLTYGWAYGSSGKALQGKELLLAVSTGAPADVYNREVSYNVHELLRPFQQMARFTGMSYLPPFVTYGTLGMDEATVAQQAEKLVEAVSRENVQALDMYA